jgi:DNA polymerase-3 subunit delta'
MAFKDIIGQQKAVAMLMGMIKRQRLASSYLFCGEAGIGKKTTALQFAKALNCLNTGAGENLIQGAPEPATVDACDACESCTKITAGSHPDVILAAPEERHDRRCPFLQAL